MMRVEKIVICLAVGLALNAGVRAADVVLPGNPYAPIVVRNVFGLNPPPLPVSPEDANPPPKITPNGIMSIFGQSQVLFKVADVDKRPGKPAMDQCYILAEGQQQDDIKVVKIDEKAAIITFDNHGKTQELPLVIASANSTAGTTSPTANSLGYNGGNRIGGGRIGASGGYGGNNFGGRNGGGNNGGNFNNGAGYAADLQTSSAGGDDSSQQPGNSQQLAMTSEDQAGMIEVQRLQYQRQLEALQEAPP